MSRVSIYEVMPCLRISQARHKLRLRFQVSSSLSERFATMGKSIFLAKVHFSKNFIRPVRKKNGSVWHLKFWFPFYFLQDFAMNFSSKVVLFTLRRNNRNYGSKCC